MQKGGYDQTMKNQQQQQLLQQQASSPVK